MCENGTDGTAELTATSDFYPWQVTLSNITAQRMLTEHMGSVTGVVRYSAEQNVAACPIYSEGQYCHSRVYPDLRARTIDLGFELHQLFICIEFMTSVLTTYDGVVSSAIVLNCKLIHFLAGVRC